MVYLEGNNLEEAMNFINQALGVAKGSTCERRKCGSVIVKDEEIIGEGFNSPSGGEESQRRCKKDKTKLHCKVTDKTCCVHAEQRAIIDALKKNPEKLKGSRLYFISSDENGKLSFAGKPYCTICSKMAFDVGVKEFVLYHEEGIKVYGAEEYNLISYGFSD